MPTILLVEDNDINRDMLSRRLERNGYQVVVAVNGSEAVAKTLSARPDIVLMDLHLPILDGWAATQQLKANPQTRVIPVIALTADGNAGEREKALAAGCDEYDTKPVDLPRLLQKITKLLEPVIVPAPAPPNLPSDPRSQQILLNRLHSQLDPPIYRIVGYSDLLLDILSDSARPTLREPQQPDLCSDIQKIHTSGMRILQLVQAMLNPVLLELQQQEINIFTPTLRLEILTPLSTIIGYCEMLLEEAATDLVPDLEQIYTSAQDLLGVANSLDSPIDRQPISLQSLAEPFCVGDSLPLGTGKRYANGTKIDPDDLSLAMDWTRSKPIDLPRSPIATDRRILIVDDNESYSTLLSRQLARYGSQVTISMMDRVLDTLAAMPYDLILLEIGRTGSGLQVLAQLKQGEWRHIPVLILAAPDRLDLVLRGIAMGAADYVNKPFPSVLLQTKIAACLELQRRQGQDESFDSLFENAPVGVYQATVTGCYRRVNPALVELLGYPDAATLMAMVTDIADRIYVDRNRYADFKTMLAEHDRVTGFEYQAYRYDGDPIWIAEHARAVRDREGKLVAYEGIVEEISQRKQAEAKLQPQLAALQLELANIKRTQQVAEIVQTDYFQQLQPNCEVSTAGGTAPIENGTSLQSSLPLKVLLVEDNELNSDMLSRRLQRAGYAVVVASDGADGVAKALSERPDLILMDISLPIMDGWEATQQIKANAQTAHIPIIALTAHAMAGDREKALAAGCNDYDTKPVELPRLLGKIEDCLKRSISN
jgi:PAS domain S-box-containing protein